MLRKKSAFLFGAGAALAWNGPTTSELTTLVRKSGFRIKGENVTIAEFIYQRLLKDGFPEWQVNFETIISVIEELIVYYSKFDGDKKLPSLLNCLFTSRYEDQLLNFSIDGGDEKHGYKLLIPEGVDYDFSKNAYYNQTPPQFFFQHLLGEILTDINARISKYAYHTQGNHSVIKTESTDSINFRKWMKALSDKRILRLYSLNYDRLFKILLCKENLSVFEGFDCDEFIGPGISLRANIPKILTDIDSHVHYNLHGSAFWEVIEEDRAQLPNPEIFLTGAPSLAVNDSYASVQVEKGRTITATNIVTGYQKAQRGMITPFKQMQASFDPKA